MTCRLVSAVAFAAASATLTLTLSTAHAEQPAAAASAPADGAKPLAESLTGFAKDEYLAAHRLFAAGDHAKALLKFESAYAASKDARLFWNYGACHKAMLRYSDAIRDLEQYKTEASTQLTEKDRADAEGLIGALRAYVAPVTIRASEPGASVIIDDVTVGQTPVERRLVDIGSHRLKVSKAGFTDYATALEVTGPSDLVQDVALARAPHEGRISVHAGSGDAIALDGTNVGMAQYEGVLGSGEHTVVVSAPGKRRYTGRVVIEDGQFRTMDVTLETDKPLVPLWVWISAGALVVTGLAVGTALLVRGDSTPQAQIVNGSIPPGTLQLPSWRM